MLTAEDIESLKEKWFKIRRKGSEFYNMLDFIDFAEESGFKAGMRITRKTLYLPHSRENTTFTTKEDAERIKKIRNNKKTDIDDSWITSFCDNWNKNIHDPFKTEPVEKKNREVWQYEHPDRIREMRNEANKRRGRLR